MFIKEIFFPRFCLGCKQFGKYICTNCRQQLIRLENQSCLYCYRASYMGLTHPQCLRQSGIDGVISIFKYNNFLKKIIKAVKYRLATDILDELILAAGAEITLELSFFSKLDGRILFQPIPLHKQRLRERGFNQAQLIVKKLKRAVDIKDCNFLIRTKKTTPQAQIANRRERFANAQGAFGISKQGETMVRGRAFFLVDDVVTTGSTVKEAARTLKLHKAAKVYVFTLAKG